MKTPSNRVATRAFLLVCISFCATSPADAAKTWTGATDGNWATATNWLETALPGTTETVILNSDSTGVLAINLSANRTIRGINLTSPAGPITFFNNNLTIGNGGINMSAATVDLSLNSANNILQSGAFRWDVPAGRTLSFAAVPHRNSPTNGLGGGNNDNVGGVVRVSTTGTVNLNTPSQAVVNDNIAGSGTNGGGNPYMTYGDDAFAATDAAGIVIAATNVSWAASVGAGFSVNPGEVAASFTQNGNGGFMGIVFKDASEFHTVTFQGSTTFTGRAVLMTPGCAGGTIQGGFLRANRSSTAGATFSIIQNSTAGDLTIGAVISMASSSTPTAITKSGPGKVILTGNNGYGGRTFIHQGTLQVGAGSNSGSLSGSNVINNAALVFDRSDALTSAQLISGTGTLTKAGTGTLTLGTANTYTGATTLTGGLANIGAATSFGATSSLTLDGGGIQWSAAADISVFPVTIAAGGATFDTNGQAVTLASSVGNGGGGALTKSGGGSLTLAAANAYSGGTTVQAGTLLAANTSGSATGSGAVTVDSGGTLGGGGFITGAVTLLESGILSPGITNVGTLTVGSLALEPGSLLDFGFGTGGNDQVSVTEPGGLVIHGGALTLRQDGTSIAFATAGTYNLISYAGGIGGSGVSALSVANPQPGFGYTFGTAGGFVTLTIAPSGIVRDWVVNGGGSWADSANWNGTFPDGTGATANFHTALTAPATVTLDGNRTVAAITFLSGNHGYTIAAGSGGSLILNGGSGNGAILNGAGSHTISAPVALSTATTVDTQAADDHIILSGIVSGSAPLSKVGPGTLELLAANTFSGTLTLSGGTTRFANGGLGTGNLTMAASRLAWSPGNTQDISNRTITFDSGAIGFDVGENNVTLAHAIGDFGVADFVKSGSGKLTLTEDATFAGNVTVQSGTLQLGNGGITGSVPQNIINHGSLVFNRSDDYQMFGLISGTGSLVHAGSGPLGLGGSNTHGGTTAITHPAGVLELINGLALQNSTLLYQNGGGSLTFGFNGAATLGGLEGDKDLTLTNTVPGPVNLTVGGNNQSTSYTGILAGEGGLTKIGTGTLTLGGVNHTYTGATTVNGGVLEIPAGGGITTTSANVGVGARLLINGGSLSSSVFSTFQNGGIAITLDGGSLSFDGGVQSSQNDGSLMEIWDGSFSALDLILRRTAIYNDVAGNPSPAVAGNSGFVVNGGTATITNSLQIGTGNSSASALVNGGDLTVGGIVTLGNTSNTRWNLLEIRNGEFTSTEATQGILLSPNAATANRSLFLVSGGTATVERISFGAEAGAAGTGRVTVSGGTLYVGSGGMTQHAPAFTSQIHLAGGTLAAKAAWSTNLPLTLTGISVIEAANAAMEPQPITLNGHVSGTGSLIKDGAGTLTLGGGHSYAGDTIVAAGTLVLGTASLSDTAIVDVTTGAVLNLSHGEVDVVADFRIDGLSQGPGTYHAANTGGRITGSGSLQVIGSDPFADWIAAFSVGGLTAKTDDPDGDGLTNLEEFALDGNPASGIATGKVRSRMEAIGAEQALVITLPVRDGASFSGAVSKSATIDGVVYTIAGTNNLAAFDQGVTEITASTAGMPTLATGWSYRSFRLNGAIGGATPRGPMGFLRLSVAAAP